MSNGLRFDIYERVHLPENVAAIDELEEVELVPRIQVIDQGEHVLLQGQLVLNGIYRAQGAGDEQVALEHWIPVEITLPMNRVARLEEITVDIDTFDVVLLSAKTLNLTGVLSLRGITLEQEEDSESWNIESFTASHVRGEEAEDEELEQQSHGEGYQHQYIEDQHRAYVQDEYEAGQNEQYSDQQYASSYEQQEQQQEVVHQNYQSPDAHPFFEVHYEAQSSEQYRSEEADDWQQQQQHFEQQLQYEHEGDFAQYIQQKYGALQQEQVISNEGYRSQHENNEQQYIYEQPEAQQQVFSGLEESHVHGAEAELSDADAESSTEWQREHVANEQGLQQEISHDETAVEPLREGQEQAAYYTEEEFAHAQSHIQSHDNTNEQWSQWETGEQLEQREQWNEEVELQSEELQTEQEIEESPISTVEREVHIALSGNSAENETQGIRTILNSSLREQAAQVAANQQKEEEERQQAEAVKQHVVDEEIEWQQLFLNKQRDQNEFKRIRMIIVQKEDTLEQIANRYSISPRDLLVRNNLHESAISEGQLLYIP